MDNISLGARSIVDFRYTNGNSTASFAFYLTLIVAGDYIYAARYIYSMANDISFGSYLAVHSPVIHSEHYYTQMPGMEEWKDLIKEISSIEPL